MTYRVVRAMEPFETITVSIEKLGDGSIAVRAISQSTQRVLLDRAFVVTGGLEQISIHITREGVGYEAW